MNLISLIDITYLSDKKLLAAYCVCLFYYVVIIVHPSIQCKRKIWFMVTYSLLFRQYRPLIDQKLNEKV